MPPPGVARPATGRSRPPADRRRSASGSSRGRWLTDADTIGAPDVALINQSMAAKYWEGQDPIGRRFRMGGPNTAVDHRRRHRRQRAAQRRHVRDQTEVLSAVSGSVHQSTGNPARNLTLVVKTTGDPAGARRARSARRFARSTAICRSPRCGRWTRSSAARRWRRRGLTGIECCAVCGARARARGRRASMACWRTWSASGGRRSAFASPSARSGGTSSVCSSERPALAAAGIALGVGMSLAHAYRGRPAPRRPAVRSGHVRRRGGRAPGLSRVSRCLRSARGVDGGGSGHGSEADVDCILSADTRTAIIVASSNGSRRRGTLERPLRRAAALLGLVGPAARSTCSSRSAPNMSPARSRLRRSHRCRRTARSPGARVGPPLGVTAAGEQADRQARRLIRSSPPRAAARTAGCGRRSRSGARVSRDRACRRTASRTPDLASWPRCRDRSRRRWPTRSWPRASRVRSEAWMFAISSAAPTPLPDTSPTSSAIWPSASAK